MTSRVYQVNNRVVRRNPVPMPEEPDLHTSVPQGGKKASGNMSQSEARQLQTLKYSEDKVKFSEKEKQKAEKKRAEKFKRYSHVNVGARLQSEEPDTDLTSIRMQQQSTYENSSMDGLRLEQEREATRLKREEKKKEEKMKKTCVSISSGQPLNAEPCCSNANTATSQDIAAGQYSKSKEEKEEEYRRQMRAARERMQQCYDQNKN